jgi:hypothetical protein
VRKEEPATAFDRLGIAIPKGTLRLERDAVMNKVYVAVQQERTMFASDFEVVRMVHDERR